MTRVRLAQLHPAGAADGYVPTFDEAAGVYVPAPGGGGGGGGGVTGIDDPATFEAIWGATPLVPDLEFDGETVALPTDWAWVNQGDSFYEETAGYGYLYAASTGGSTNGGDTHRMLVRPIPTESAFRIFLNVADVSGEAAAWTRWAIVLRDSTSGKYLLFGPATDTPNAWGIHLSEWSGLNTFQNNLMVKGLTPELPKYLMVRKVSATNWHFLTSNRGKVWTPWWSGYDPAGFSGGAASFDQIGILASTNDASFTYGLDIELGWFRVR